MRPVGGTHVRTPCQSCGGAWQQRGDELLRSRWGSNNPDEIVCDTCIELVWGTGIGDYDMTLRVLAKTRCIELSKTRRVSGAIIGRDTVAWQFVNKGIETDLSLSHDAMQAVILIYAALLRERVANEWTQVS